MTGNGHPVANLNFACAIYVCLGQEISNQSQTTTDINFRFTFEDDHCHFVLWFSVASILIWADLSKIWLAIGFNTVQVVLNLNT